ncbi:hypothetical protein BDV59DRAFT_189231 [Aspergillus ambiguus]|uniref:uncharacterized protein n=1 Tax=Aspergillus ambiguus TaxID=176160 RepID=UPI003CCCB3D4
MGIQSLNRTQRLNELIDVIGNRDMDSCARARLLNMTATVSRYRRFLDFSIALRRNSIPHAT